MAALTVVGQCLGAGEKDQAVYYSRRLMLFAYCGAWFMNLSAFLFANKFALGLFSLSPEAYAMALEVMVWFNIVSLFIWPSSFTMPNILRAAGDIMGVFRWMEGGEMPETVYRSNIQPTRLLTMQTRNSAAYKGVMALILQDSPLDFMTGHRLSGCKSVPLLYRKSRSVR